MKLEELFTKLAYGELSNLALSEGGVITEPNRPKVITAINAALTDMYTRIHLNERELLVQTLEWKAIYPLRKRHAQMDDTKDVKYIMDTPNNRFTDDIVKILQVNNEIGCPLPLNDPELCHSVFTPHFDTVQFTHTDGAPVYSVMYQALHPKLVMDGDVLNQEVMVPSVLEGMLCTKVASNILTPMGGQEFTIQAQHLEASYETMMAEVEQRNLALDIGISSNFKLTRRGFC